MARAVKKVAKPKKLAVVKAAKVDRREAPTPLAARGTDRSHGRSSVTELSWAEFDRQIQALARAAAKSFKPQAVVGLVHGGVFVGGAVASALKVDFFPVRITRRSRDHGGQAASDDMPRELKGKRVLLVDDIAGSGDSLEMASRLARTAGAAKLACATLVSRPSGFRPDFTAFSSESFFVFPWDYQDVVGDAQVDPDTAGA